MPLPFFSTPSLERETLGNHAYRRVLYTTRDTQLVLMKIPAGTEIGEEVHTENDQFFRIEYGQGLAVIDKYEMDLNDGAALLVPKGIRHNIIAHTDLYLYTIYSPPHHPPDTLQWVRPKDD